MGLLILLLSSFLSYIMIDLAVDPLEDLYTSTDPDAPAQIEQRIEMLNLDATVFERYATWFGAFVTGDPGVSWETGQPVADELRGAVIGTLHLVTAATFLSIILGVSVGIVSALRQYTSFDYIVVFFSFVLYSLPVFWVAVLLKQWGAIGFNDFLADPHLSPTTIGIVAVIGGALISMAMAGSRITRLISFVVGAAAVAGMLFYLQGSGWWNDPHIGPALLILNGLGVAFAITLLSTGLENRRALFTSLSVVALTLALYLPVQWLFDVTDAAEITGAPLIAGLGLVCVAVGALVGRFWGGPDWKQSARTGGIVAAIMGAMVFLDRIMQAWPSYNANPRISGRPIRTFQERTPGFQGDFWESTLNLYGHLILPTLALMLISFASYTRYSRGSMLEVLNQDYMRTARAKGLAERTVIMRHGFRNTLIPLATLVPVDVIGLLGGALITERIFARPGMGTMFLANLEANVIEPVMAYLVIVAALAILANMVADLMYAALDPRIRVNA
ncbi:ABC transporter permease [Pseudactinotalea sp. Z1732]|uniref:ABC transporter permease n=1 Tax=Micrococcales TaxID=85006 RepID=UPI003C7DF81F